MRLLPRSLRRPRAGLRIEAEIISPPDQTSGGDVRIRVALLPMENFRIRRGWLELSRVTTRFSRTVLDGYLEHEVEKIHRTVELCAHTPTVSGICISFLKEIPIAADTDLETGPRRVHWKVTARFQAYGFRQVVATRALFPKGAPGGNGPVVDGAGFLPLYEFRSDSGP